MTKILVVGGTGFVGYHLCKKCLNLKCDVTSISTRKPKSERFLKKVKYKICNISKKKNLEKKINEKFDYVVNLGGYVDHKNKKKTRESHYLGCKNLADFFLNKKILKFVQIGSSIENGKIKSPQKEVLIKNYRTIKSVYGISKLKASHYLISLYKKHKFPAIILRLYLAYGTHQDKNRFIPIIINSCLKNKKFNCSEGKQFRDFIYVSDVVDSITKSLKSNIEGEIFNIGSGKPKKIKSIIRQIKSLANGGTPNYGKIKMRKDEILKLYPNIMKVKKKLKWRPKIKFNSGLNKTLQYYKSLNQIKLQ